MAQELLTTAITVCYYSMCDMGTYVCNVHCFFYPLHLLQGVPKDLFADCVIVPVEVSTSAYVRMYVQIADKMLMPSSHFHHSTGCSINGAFCTHVCT